MSQTSVGVDFTLETVQYKFASIIGELCGKPSVLSQFAVWLDLRLAEYKLKGSISLDCSGLKPNPEWLEGLKDSSHGGKSHTAASDRLSSGQYSRSRGRTDRSSSGHSVSHRTNHQRSSPEVLVIKEELDDCNDHQRVYPVACRENEAASHLTHRRKHSFSDDAECSPLKSPRISLTPQDNMSESMFLSSHEMSVDHSTSSGDLLVSDIDNQTSAAVMDSAYQRGSNSADSSSAREDHPAELFADGTSFEPISEPSLQKILNIESSSRDEPSGSSAETESLTDLKSFANLARDGIMDVLPDQDSIVKTEKLEDFGQHRTTSTRGKEASIMSMAEKVLCASAQLPVSRAVTTFPHYSDTALVQSLLTGDLSKEARMRLIRSTISMMRRTTWQLEDPREPRADELRDMAIALVEKYPVLSDDVSGSTAGPNYDGLLKQLKRRLGNVKPVVKAQGSVPNRSRSTGKSAKQASS